MRKPAALDYIEVSNELLSKAAIEGNEAKRNAYLEMAEAAINKAKVEVMNKTTFSIHMTVVEDELDMRQMAQNIRSMVDRHAALRAYQ